MIGTLDPHVVQASLIRPAERLCVVARCGECGTFAGGKMARMCREPVCGLLDRQHHDRTNAA